MSDLEKIEQRMASGKPFTFMDLCLLVPYEEYRIADRAIQKWRKAGLISFTRAGRSTVWSLTDAGRAHFGMEL